MPTTQELQDKRKLEELDECTKRAERSIKNLAGSIVEAGLDVKTALDKCGATDNPTLEEKELHKEIFLLPAIQHIIASINKIDDKDIKLVVKTALARTLNGIT